jgi:predicted esterase
MKRPNDTTGFPTGGLVAVACAALLSCAGGSANEEAPGTAGDPGAGGVVASEADGGTHRAEGAGGGGANSAGSGLGAAGTSGHSSDATLEDGGAPVGKADGGNRSDAPPGGGACTITDQTALCPSKSIVSITNGTDTRRIYWNTPADGPPAGGWPAVVLYQGSIYGPSLSWDVSLPKSTGFGGYFQVVLIAKLLESGFTVIQPEAQGGLAWNTNDGSNYDASPDAVFIPELLAEMASEKFGPINMSRLYATGISSGGYMTSRMAVSYPGRFRALAIESGSYATCLGPICMIPSVLPADHPPTLILHGDADTIVPVSTAKAYYDALVSNGIEAKFIEDPTAGHQWLEVAPSAVTSWFLSH